MSNFNKSQYQGKAFAYYTNSTVLPLRSSSSVFDSIEAVTSGLLVLFLEITVCRERTPSSGERLTAKAHVLEMIYIIWHLTKTCTTFRLHFSTGFGHNLHTQMNPSMYNSPAIKTFFQSFLFAKDSEGLLLQRHILFIFEFFSVKGSSTPPSFNLFSTPNVALTLAGHCVYHL